MNNPIQIAGDLFSSEQISAEIKLTPELDDPTNLGIFEIDQNVDVITHSEISTEFKITGTLNNVNLALQTLKFIPNADQPGNIENNYRYEFYYTDAEGVTHTTSGVFTVGSVHFEWNLNIPTTYDQDTILNVNFEVTDLRPDNIDPDIEYQVTLSVDNAEFEYPEDNFSDEVVITGTKSHINSEISNINIAPGPNFTGSIGLEVSQQQITNEIDQTEDGVINSVQTNTIQVPVDKTYPIKWEILSNTQYDEDIPFYLNYQIKDVRPDNIDPDIEYQVTLSVDNAEFEYPEDNFSDEVVITGTKSSINADLSNIKVIPAADFVGSITLNVNQIQTTNVIDQTSDGLINDDNVNVLEIVNDISHDEYTLNENLISFTPNQEFQIAQITDLRPDFVDSDIQYESTIKMLLPFVIDNSESEKTGHLLQKSSETIPSWTNTFNIWNSIRDQRVRYHNNIGVISYINSLNIDSTQGVYQERTNFNFSQDFQHVICDYNLNNFAWYRNGVYNINGVSFQNLQIRTDVGDLSNLLFPQLGRFTETGLLFRARAAGRPTFEVYTIFFQFSDETFYRFRGRPPFLDIPDGFFVFVDYSIWYTPERVVSYDYSNQMFTLTDSSGTGTPVSLLIEEKIISNEYPGWEGVNSFYDRKTNTVYITIKSDINGNTVYTQIHASYGPGGVITMSAIDTEKYIVDNNGLLDGLPITGYIDYNFSFNPANQTFYTLSFDVNSISEFNNFDLFDEIYNFTFFEEEERVLVIGQNTSEQNVYQFYSLTSVFEIALNGTKQEVNNKLDKFSINDLPFDAHYKQIQLTDNIIQADINFTVDSNVYTVEFDIGDGTLISGDLVQQVFQSNDAIAPEVQAPSGFYLLWDTDFTNVQDDIVVNAVYEELINVEFDIGDGTLISGDLVQQIIPGEDAIAPLFDDPEGFRFVEWDTDFTNVQGDIVVNAVYEELELYTVEFDIGDGTLISGDLVQQVFEGFSANAPVVEAPAEYFLESWDTDFTNVQGDIVVNAVYELITYTVQFNIGNGTLISGDLVQQIIPGEDAIAPEVQAPSGQELYEWDTDFTNVQDDIVVNAVYGVLTPPGPNTLIDGDAQLGYYGEVPTSLLFAPGELESALNASNWPGEENTTFDDAGWLKFAWKGQIFYIPKRPLRFNVNQAFFDLNNIIVPTQSGLINHQTFSYTHILPTSNYTQFTQFTPSRDGVDLTDNNSCSVNLGEGSMWNELIYKICEDVPDCSVARENHGGPQVGNNFSQTFSASDLQLNYEHLTASVVDGSWEAVYRSNSSGEVEHMGTTDEYGNTLAWRPALRLNGYSAT